MYNKVIYTILKTLIWHDVIKTIQNGVVLVFLRTNTCFLKKNKKIYLFKQKSKVFLSLVNITLRMHIHY